MEAIKGNAENKFVISLARADDYERIRELLVRELHTRPEVFTKERFEAAIRRFGKYYLVARKDDKVVGFVSGFDDTGIFYGYMGRLVVDAEYRNQGIGTSLAEACLAELKKAGVLSVIAGVRRDNLPSERLLRKTGFRGDDCTQLMNEL